MISENGKKFKKRSRPSTRPGRREGKGGKKWNDEIPVRAYEFAVSGMTNTQVAKSLGVSPMMFSKWVERKPVLRSALERARKPRENVDSMMGAIRGRMSRKVMKLWDQMTAWQNEPNAIRKIELLLKDHSIRVRQHLFVNAMYAFNFNVSEACRFVNIRRSTFNQWVMTEPGFAEMIDEIQEAVKDICVSNALKASNAGDVSATIFLCKTLARDRGFAEKLEVEHTHRGSIAIEEMELPPKVLRELKRALEKKNEDKGANYGRGLPAPDDEDIIDAEYSKKEEGDEEDEDE